jgi:hypothetical protein
MPSRYEKPKPMVRMTVHRSVMVGDQRVTQHFDEWVRHDDPRLPGPSGVRFVTGPMREDGSEIFPGDSDWPSGPEVQPASVECATPALEAAPTAPASAEDSQVALSKTDALALVNALSIPKKEPRPEVSMPSEEAYDNADYENSDDSEEEDDRPWKITRRTLAQINTMSPSDLEALLQNLDAHEEWRDLRETAKDRTAQWLGAIKKAEAAPRCQYTKTDGKVCGSPAIKDESFCYFHGEARTKRKDEEASNLHEVPVLEDKLSLQLAITRLCAQLASGSIDEKRGRVLIAALRLAQKNLGESSTLYG